MFQQAHRELKEGKRKLLPFNVAGRNLFEFSKTPVVQRIKNASKEETYLNAEVQIIAANKCENINIQGLENLLYRFLLKPGYILSSGFENFFVGGLAANYNSVGLGVESRWAVG